MIKMRTVFFLCCMALSPISYAGECPHQAFKQQAEKLDKSTIKSVIKLKEQFIKVAAEQSLECRSLLVGDLRRYHSQLAEEYLESEKSGYVALAVDASPEAAKKHKAELFKVGLGLLYQGEGVYDPGVKSAWYLKEFGTLLPESWRKYLSQCVHEEKNRLFDDAAVMITWEDLRKRIMFWEVFLDTYPEFPEKDSAEGFLVRYLTVYLAGSENTPIYTWDTQVLDGDIKISYEAFIRLNMKSKFYKVLQSHYAIIQKNSYVIDTKTDEKLNVNVQYILSKRCNTTGSRHYPFVCYTNKSKTGTGKITYQKCIRSDITCSDIGLFRFGGYPSDLKAHQAFERCIGGAPRFVDAQGM